MSLALFEPSESEKKNSVISNRNNLFQFKVKRSEIHVCNAILLPPGAPEVTGEELMTR